MGTKKDAWETHVHSHIHGRASDIGPRLLCVLVPLQSYPRLCVQVGSVVMDRTKAVYCAKLAEQAERYDEMAVCA